MSILERIFGNVIPQQPVAQPQQQQQAPTTPGNLPANPPVTNPVATSATAANGVVPNNTATDGTAKSGLDQFADLWNTTNQGQQGQPLFNVSQEKMLEAARKQNFVADLPKEILDKMAAGGAEGMQAMLEAMNYVGQRSYAQSAFAGTRLIEGALEKSQFARQADIDTRFKSLSVHNTLQAENPVFSNPAAKPMLDAIQNNLIVKYPNATPAELSNMAKEYLSSFATALTAPQTQAAQQQQVQTAQGTDWGKFFNT